MASSELVQLKKTIKKSKRYKRLRDILDDNDIEQYNIPVNEYLSEAKSRFFARKFRQLDSNSVHILDELTAAQMEDAALRSRLTEMLVVCSQAKKSISRLLESYENATLIEYSSAMRTVISTKDERRSFISDIVKPFYSYLNEVETLHEQLSLLIVDVDKSGYALKNIIETQRLIYRPELAGRT